MDEWGLLRDPAATGVAGVLGTALLGWLGQRLVGRAALEQAMRDTFKELLSQLRQELKVALTERDKARDENVELQATIEELRTTISALELRVAGAVLPRAPQA